MNEQETMFYNNVTGFSTAVIKKALKKTGDNKVKSWIIKQELGTELAKAQQYYNSPDAQTSMDDAGLTYNSICDFFQSITGGTKKSACYKLIKVAQNIDENSSAPRLFVTAVQLAVSEGLSPKQNNEGFNYFCANAELKYAGATTESESEASEEDESEASEESGTKYSFSMKAVDGEAGGCIRLDDSYNIIAEDGDVGQLMVSMVAFFHSKGFAVTQND
jgi:hypothetical protein